MDDNFSNVLIEKDKTMDLYIKKSITIHFVYANEFGSLGDSFILHTREGDVVVASDDSGVILVGPMQDIYPISRTDFDAKYEILDEVVSEDAETTFKAYGITKDKIRSCRLKKTSYVYGKCINKPFSVLKNDGITTLYGKSGDYYVCSYDDPSNVYIIDRDIFNITYEKVII